MGRVIFRAVLAVLLAAVPAAADVPEAQRAEVDHLLAFIAGSGCAMQRNGKAHTPEEAVRHVTRKYDHFQDRIASTEDFVRLSATRSELSGHVYMVLCPGEPPRPVSEWLLEELRRFRNVAVAGERAAP